MRVSVLSSGSKGNCTYIEVGNHKILIDIGTSSLYVEKALKSLKSFTILILYISLK